MPTLPNSADYAGYTDWSRARSYVWQGCKYCAEKIEPPAIVCRDCDVDCKHEWKKQQEEQKRLKEMERVVGRAILSTYAGAVGNLFKVLLSPLVFVSVGLYLVLLTGRIACDLIFFSDSRR